MRVSVKKYTSMLREQVTLHCIIFVYVLYNLKHVALNSIFFINQNYFAELSK